MPPDLDTLRAAARRLWHAVAAGDSRALGRLGLLRPAGRPPAPEDALTTIAREHGFDTWLALKDAAVMSRLDRAERAERLRRALFFGHHRLAGSLLAHDPDLPRDDFGLEIALYDLEAVRRTLTRAPETAAIEPLGARTPILHLAYSRHIHAAPEKRGEMLATAALLVAFGANVNDGYAPEPRSEHRISALYGALCHADNLPLAEWLLTHQASPDDNESLYHATELGHTAGLTLLMRHGVKTRGTNALARALDFGDVDAVRLLLDHGADPNEAVAGHPSGEPVDTIPALHQAARRWCKAEIGTLLLERGADPKAEWHGRTPYALARIHGNTALARLLEERGHATALSDTDALLAACAAGTQPSLRLDPATLDEEDRRLLTRLVAGPVPLAHLEALVALGLDPEEPDAMGLTPLHVAGWEGLPDRVAWLLTLGPDLTHRNAYGGDALETVIHGAEFCPNRATRDHIACARRLLEAGATLTPEMIDEGGDEGLTLFLEGWAIHR